MKRIAVTLLSILIIMLFITPSLSIASPIQRVDKSRSIVIDPNWMEKIPQKLFDDIDKERNSIKSALALPSGLRITGIIPLYSVGKAYNALILADSSIDTLKWIIDHSLRLIYKFSLLNGNSLYYVLATRDQLKDIAKNPSVYRVMPSPPLTKLVGDSSMEKIFKAEGSLPLAHHVYSRISSDENIKYLKGVQLIGAVKTWEEYGINGSGVVVGIVDTGVDFSEPELGVDAIARGPNGTALLLSMNNGLTLTYRNATAVNGTLITDGLWTLAFDPLYSLVYGYPVLVNVTFDTNISLGNHTSQSGVYHVGVAPYMFGDFVTGYFIRTFTVAIVYDSQTPGVYDKVVFDLSTSFYSLSRLMRWLELNTLGVALWREPDPAWDDNSVADEPAFGPGNEVVARDFDNDSIPDFSIGTIAGYYADYYGLTGVRFVNGSLVPGEPGLYPGWDYNGTYFALIQDWHGHGTSVATVIAARGRFAYDIYGDGNLYRIKGVAPAAKIATGDAWLFGDLLPFEAWLAGFDIVIYESGGYVYLGFNPYGPHRADVISNSWSHVYANFWMQQFPGYDVNSDFMDTIVLVRRLLIGDNVIIAFAAGNEGPGYSTVGSPSAGLLTVTVGASTLWDWIKIYGYPPGYEDDIIPFSSRGPSGLGYPKPDVVNIGAYEWAGQRTIDGRGYGAGFDLFGGTSEATPFTSGSIALIIQAYREKTNGSSPDVVTVKRILKSAAKDLGYPAFSQGSGRVDVYEAVKTILEGGWKAYVPEGIQEAFLELYGNDWGSLAPGIAQLLSDTAYYGVVPPGTSKNFTIFLEGFGEAHISAWNTVLQKEYVVYDGVYRFDHMLFPVIPRYVYQDADYLEVVMVVKNISYPPGEFQHMPPDTSHEIILSAYDWIDYNGDGQVGYPSELHYISFDSRVSTEAVLAISNPAQKIHGDLVLRVRPSPSAVNITPAYIELVVRTYKKVPCKVVSFSNTTLYVDGSANVTATVNIPDNFRPGILEVRIEIDTPEKKIVIPASIVVPLVLDNVATVKLGGVRSPMKYDPFALYGLADWYYGVWEGQDWRILPILITDPSIAGAAIVVRWGSGYSTDLSFLALPPGGAYTATGSPNLFAAYKLSYDLGLVYNPSLSDQMKGKLRVFLPTKWSTALQNLPIAITSLGEWPPNPGLALVGFNGKLPTVYGVYRLVYGFASYSGKLLEDKLMFRIITVKSYANFTPIAQVGDIVYGSLDFMFHAGAYTPFLFADLYLYEWNYAAYTPSGVFSYISFSILENGTAGSTIKYPILYDYGYYLGWSPYGRHVEGSIPVLINTTGWTGELDMMLVMYDYTWRSEGEYLYWPSTGELLIAGYWHPGIVTGQYFG